MKKILAGAKVLAATVIGIVLLSALAAGRPALGQNVVVQVNAFDAQGLIIGAAPGKLQLNVNGRPWIVQLDAKEFGDNAKTMVKLTAAADPSILRVGAYVRFPAMLDEKGRAAEPVQELTIFTPNEHTRYGVFPTDPSAVEEKPKEKKQKPREAAAQQPPPAKAAQSGKSFVVGQVAGIRKGTLTVQIPGERLGVKVADDVKVRVDVTDKQLALSMLQAGDSIHVRGFYKDPGMAYAQQIDVELQRVLGAQPPKGNRHGDVAAANPAGQNDGDAGDRHGDFGVPEEDKAGDDKPADGKRGRIRVLKVN